MKVGKGLDDLESEARKSNSWQTEEGVQEVARMY